MAAMERPESPELTPEIEASTLATLAEAGISYEDVVNCEVKPFEHDVEGQKY
jgi:hypothetical protein